MSLTIRGLLIFCIAWLVNKASIQLDTTQISHLADQLIIGASAVMQVVGLIIVYIGRYRHGDIYWWGGKKPLV